MCHIGCCVMISHNVILGDTLSYDSGNMMRCVGISDTPKLTLVTTVTTTNQSLYMYIKKLFHGNQCLLHFHSTVLMSFAAHF